MIEPMIGTMITIRIHAVVAPAPRCRRTMSTIVSTTMRTTTTPMRVQSRPMRASSSIRRSPTIVHAPPSLGRRAALRGRWVGSILRSSDKGRDMTDEQLEEMGPIDYIVIEWPGRQPTREAAPIILDLHDRGIIRILDVAFMVKDEDGNAAGISVEDYGAAEFG